ncbi:MAG: hypothetical protein KAR39_04610 [Thermoplasmata archaeon]|nr:hypothetical protein [Thermoplasmata archaeon]
MSTEKCNDAEVQELMDEALEIHTLWHKLHDYLESHDRNIDNLSGYDDIRCMDAFCKDNPDIIRVHVDDSYHCNSYAYIVPHESEKRYMGATVLFIPQCCDTRNQFFLYPGDNRSLLSACLRLEDKFQGKGDETWKKLHGDLNEDGEDTKD